MSSITKNNLIFRSNISFWLCCVLLSLSLCSFAQTSTEGKNIDDLIQKAAELKRSDIESSILVLEEALELSQKEKVAETEIRIYLKLASTYLSIKDISLAEKNYAQAFLLSEKENKAPLKLQSLIGRASVEERKGKYEKAIELLFDAKIIANHLGLKPDLANINSNLAHIYYNYQDIDKAIEYLIMSEAIYLEIEDTLALAFLYNNLGILQKENKQIEEAKQTFLKSLLFCVSAKDSIGIGLTKNNLGYFYILENNIPLAESYLNEAHEIFQQFEMEDPVLFTNLAELSLLKKELDKAEHYALKALKIHKERNIKNEEMQNHEVLSRIYEAQRDFEKALIHYKQFEKLETELFNKTKQQQIDAINDKHELVEHKMTLDLMNKKNKLNTYFIAGLLFLIVVILGVTMLVLRQRKLKNSANKIALEQKLLRSQMNPHFIFNALSSIQHFIFDNNPKTASKYLAKFSHLIRIILENSRKDYIFLEDELKALTYYLDLQNLRFDNLFEFEITTQNVSSDSIKIPPMLLQPFVENSIEHGIQHLTDRKGKLKLSFTLSNEALIFKLEDNGIGRLKSAEVNRHNTQRDSISTNITKERLVTFQKQHLIYNDLIIQDVKNADNEVVGTLVHLEIPYKVL